MNLVTKNKVTTIAAKRADIAPIVSDTGFASKHTNDEK
jgi:hypothetical protein